MNTYVNCNQQPKGFSLTELMVVITVMLVLVGMLFPVYSKYRTQARITETRQLMEEIEMAIQEYRNTYKAYPWQINDSAGSFMQGDTSVIVIRTLCPLTKLTSEDQTKYVSGGSEASDAASVQVLVTPLHEHLTAAEKQDVWNLNSKGEIYLPLSDRKRFDWMPFRGKPSYQMQTVVNVFHRTEGKLRGGGTALCDGTFRFRTTSSSPPNPAVDGRPRVWTEIVDVDGFVKVIDNGKKDSHCVNTSAGEISNAYDYRNLDSSGGKSPGFISNFP